MTPEPAPRRGRRDNGLDATSYVPLADVDPRIGEYLLEVLCAAGVPAYLEPPAGGSPARPITAPTAPLDRLWVDRNRRTVARSIVEAEAPGLPDQGDRTHSPARLISEDSATTPFSDDEEATWQSLVAQLEAQSADGEAVNPWPVQEDLQPFDERPPPEAPQRPDDPAHDEGARWRRRLEPEPEPFDNLLDAIDAIDTSSEEGHYEPPVPPPLPRLSRYAWLALALIGVGTLFILGPKVIDLGGRAVFILGVLLIVSGAGVLIWRLRDDHDDPEGGAVV